MPKSGEVIAARREALGMTQQQLALSIGWTPHRVGIIETRHTLWLEPEDKRKLARALGWTVEELKSACRSQPPGPPQDAP